MIRDKMKSHPIMILLHYLAFMKYLGIFIGTMN